MWRDEQKKRQLSASMLQTICKGAKRNWNITKDATCTTRAWVSNFALIDV